MYCVDSVDGICYQFCHADLSFSKVSLPQNAYNVSNAYFGYVTFCTFMFFIVISITIMLNNCEWNINIILEIIVF